MMRTLAAQAFVGGWPRGSALTNTTPTTSDLVQTFEVAGPTPPTEPTAPVWPRPSGRVRRCSGRPALRLHRGAA